MTIDLHNYEAFYLDYTEGQLSNEEEAELLAFLELHPECQQETENFAFIPLVADKTMHPEADALKRLVFEVPVSETNFEDFSIAYYEGLLSPSKTTELFNKANTNPSLRATLADYSKTMVAANLSVGYPTKSDLKKTVRSSRIWIAYSAAASLVILMVTASVMNRPKPVTAEKTNTNVAVKKVNGTRVPGSITQVETSEIITPKPTESKPSMVAHAAKPATQPEPILIPEPEVVVAITPADSIRQTKTIVATISQSEETPVTTIPSDSIPALTQPRETYPKSSINPIQNIRKKRFSMYGLLRDGINGLGSITSLKIHMDTDVDSTGKVSAYSISAGSLGYYNTVPR